MANNCSITRKGITEMMVITRIKIITIVPPNDEKRVIEELTVGKQETIASIRQQCEQVFSTPNIAVDVSYRR